MPVFFLGGVFKDLVSDQQVETCFFFARNLNLVPARCLIFLLGPMAFWRYVYHVCSRFVAQQTALFSSLSGTFRHHINNVCM